MEPEKVDEKPQDPGSEGEGSEGEGSEGEGSELEKPPPEEAQGAKFVDKESQTEESQLKKPQTEESQLKKPEKQDSPLTKPQSEGSQGASSRREEPQAPKPCPGAMSLCSRRQAEQSQADRFQLWAWSEGAQAISQAGYPTERSEFILTLAPQLKWIENTLATVEKRRIRLEAEKKLLENLRSRLHDKIRLFDPTIEINDHVCDATCYADMDRMFYRQYAEELMAAAIRQNQFPMPGPQASTSRQEASTSQQEASDSQQQASTSGQTAANSEREATPTVQGAANAEIQACLAFQTRPAHYELEPSPEHQVAMIQHRVPSPPENEPYVDSDDDDDEPDDDDPDNRPAENGINYAGEGSEENEFVVVKMLENNPHYRYRLD